MIFFTKTEIYFKKYVYWGSLPPYSTLHDFQYLFLDFPPGLSQVDGPYMNEMIDIFIAIGKIEILIHGRIDQGSVSIVFR